MHLFAEAPPKGNYGAAIILARTPGSAVEKAVGWPARAATGVLLPHRMLEYQRSLIAILFLAANAFWFLRRPLTTTAIDPADYRRRTSLWLGLTVVLFMAHSFWVFMFISAAVLLTVGRRDSNPVALYFFLLLMAPPIDRKSTRLNSSHSSPSRMPSSA